MGVEDRVRTILAPLFAEYEVELVDVEHQGATLRVCADRPGGVDLGLLQDLSRDVSRLLDEADPMPDRYTLEVSSPGLERPLRTADQFRRAVDQVVKVKTLPDVPGDRRVDGRLVVADDDGLDVALADGTVRRVLYTEVDKARTVFEWGPAPKPKGPAKKAAPPAAAVTRETTS